MKLKHLSKRFFGSLVARNPSPKEQSWVESNLSPAEFRLWLRYSKQDKRHTYDVAKRVAQSTQEKDVIAAALMHDVGKTTCNLNTFGRVFATVIRPVIPKEKRKQESGRMLHLTRYWQHASIGYKLLEQAGSEELVYTWAGEHHLPEKYWTIDKKTAQILSAADG